LKIICLCIALCAVNIQLASAELVKQSYLSHIIDWLAKLTEENDVRSLVKKNKGAVVLIMCLQNDVKDDGIIYNLTMAKHTGKRKFGTGVTSGVLLSEDGVVVCAPCEHISKSDRIFVHIDSENSKSKTKNITKNVYEAKVLKLLPALDLAFLQIKPRNKEKFPFCELGNDSELINNPDAVQFGSAVVIGKAKGKHFVTFTHPGNSDPYFDVIATQVQKVQYKKDKGVPVLSLSNVVSDSVLPENTGGPLLGPGFIGLALVEFDRYGLPKHTAIPVSTIKKGLRIAAPWLLKHSGKVSLGIKVRAGERDELSKSHLKAVDIEGKPVVVEAIEIGAPAEASGILPEDIILEVNGDQCQDCETFENLINQSIGEQTVVFKILRHGNIMELEVRR
jgi:S1-C subfamily serine protease